MTDEIKAAVIKKQKENPTDNAKAFTSFVYRLLLGVLRVGVRYTEPGHPWENPYAESLIGTLRAYFYPYIQRQKSIASIQRVYASKTQRHSLSGCQRFQNKVRRGLDFFGAFQRPFPRRSLLFPR